MATNAEAFARQDRMRAKTNVAVSSPSTPVTAAVENGSEDDGEDDDDDDDDDEDVLFSSSFSRSDLM